MEIQEKKFKVRTETYTTLLIPICASDLQIVLINNDINEIVAVLYLTVDKKITWKFNTPKEEIRKQIENKIKRLYL